MIASGKQRSYEAQVVDSFFRAEQGERFFDGPISVHIAAVFALPKSKERKRDPVPEQWHTSKPDADNIAKSILDALNGIAFKDDSQVARLTVFKWTAAQGEPARVDVEITGL